jgi:uncharacterized integral membrane protein
MASLVFITWNTKSTLVSYNNVDLVFHVINTKDAIVDLVFHVINTKDAIVDLVFYVINTKDTNVDFLVFTTLEH